MLTIDSITSGYGQTKVVHDVSLTVPDDGVVAVLGHNGAGKTTLLRTAVGLIKPTSGTITFDGEDITSLAPHARIKRGMAYVPQGQKSFEQLSTMENLQVVAEGIGRQARGRIDEALERFPALVPFLDRQAGLLSGGQRQQLSIARALITQPKLLILDEPAEGIQPNVVAEIQQTIRDLAKEGVAVLLVEQHMGFALSAASEYAVMASGRVIQQGEGGATLVPDTPESITSGAHDMEEVEEKVRMALAI
ncbi:urea ABC transporter ATP-binding subunit UrtE [Corynebacterium sputi]|uniref:urea ABC transporter ATP-binding subunit UrtE n=1 Tax=Corynebacterium sputi TaxID=489915 RepID=UPI0003FC0210|nr:urea ABC transporter ATP-binding subunit UrtE [Corynebacterium sputi]